MGQASAPRPREFLRDPGVGRARRRPSPPRPPAETRWSCPQRQRRSSILVIFSLSLFDVRPPRFLSSCERHGGVQVTPGSGHPCVGVGDPACGCVSRGPRRELFPPSLQRSAWDPRGPLSYFSSLILSTRTVAFAGNPSRSVRLSSVCGAGEGAQGLQARIFTSLVTFHLFPSP